MRQRAIKLLGGAIIVLGATQAFAADLQLGRVVGQPGQSVNVPMTYTAGGGPSVTALTVDMHFGNELTNPRCSGGAALAGADKSVRCAEVDRGVVRLLIFGLNRDPIPSGEIATVTFDVPASGRHRFHRIMSEVSASDADANPLRLARRSGVVQVGGR